MPSFSRHEIESLGSKAAEAFRSGVSLHSSIVKMAKDNQMNPEQIKRLVESANTTTFLNEFNGKSGNQRMVEFDVADPSKVISEALDTKSNMPGISITISVDAPSDLHSSMTDENRPVEPMEPTSKVASLNEPFFLQRSEDLSLDIHKKYKLEESLQDKIAHSNYTASDLADEVAGNYKNIYAKEKYASLELDALSLHGNKALPALQMLRSRLGMSKIAKELSPQQHYFLSDRHVVDSSNSTDLTKIANIIDTAANLKKLSDALVSLTKVKC